MTLSVEKIIESLLDGFMGTDEAALVRICYFDPERRVSGQSLAMPATIARDKALTMQRQNPHWEIWAEDCD